LRPRERHQFIFGSLGELEDNGMQAELKVQINKTHRNNVRDITQMMRLGLYHR
jgi:hypothetical protein